MCLRYVLILFEASFNTNSKTTWFLNNYNCYYIVLKIMAKKIVYIK